MSANPQTPVYRPPNQARPIAPPKAFHQPSPRTRRRSFGCGSCFMLLLIPLMLLFPLGMALMLAPVPTHLLVLGIDRVPEGTALGRTDTIILLSVNPLQPVVKMLSIPRDLWVSIPGVGENRINTAHFFAEAAQPGSGPAAIMQTVQQDFDVNVPYYVRVRFDTIQNVVDAFGGVTINLPTDMAGLSAGSQRLNGEQALAFVRARKGSDDFFRMEHGQLMLKALVVQALSPLSWPRLPLVAQAAFASVDTNLPAWQWPRIGLAVVRAAISDTIDNRTIQREMTTPFLTDGGADVLLPNWDRIQPLVQEMFAQ